MAKPGRDHPWNVQKRAGIKQYEAMQRRKKEIEIPEEDEVSVEEAAEQFGIPVSAVEKFAKSREEDEPEQKVNSFGRRIWTDKQKAEIVYYANKHGVKKACEVFNVANALVYKWRSYFQGNPPEEINETEVEMKAEKLREVPIGGKSPMDSDDDLEDLEPEDETEETEELDERDAKIQELQEKILRLELILGRKTFELEMLKEQLEE